MFHFTWKCLQKETNDTSKCTTIIKPISFHLKSAYPKAIDLGMQVKNKMYACILY